MLYLFTLHMPLYLQRFERFDLFCGHFPISDVVNKDTSLVIVEINTSYSAKNKLLSPLKNVTRVCALHQLTDLAVSAHFSLLFYEVRKKFWKEYVMDVDEVSNRDDVSLFEHFSFLHLNFIIPFCTFSGYHGNVRRDFHRENGYVQNGRKFSKSTLQIPPDGNFKN